MGAGTESSAGLFRDEEAAHGQTASDAFGKGDTVGLDVVVLEREERAGPADAGLDFIDEQEPVVLFAVFGDRLHVLLVEDVDAAFALDQFHHDGADRVVRGHGEV